MPGLNWYAVELLHVVTRQMSTLLDNVTIIALVSVEKYIRVELDTTYVYEQIIDVAMLVACIMKILYL